MFVLAHGFRDFSPWSFDLIAFPLVAQYIVAGTWPVRLITARKERERGRGWDSNIPLQGHDPSDLTSSH
jgi:hypothetical protein